MHTRVILSFLACLLNVSLQSCGNRKFSQNHRWQNDILLNCCGLTMVTTIAEFAWHYITTTMYLITQILHKITKTSCCCWVAKHSLIPLFWLRLWWRLSHFIFLGKSWCGFFLFSLLTDVEITRLLSNIL